MVVLEDEVELASSVPCGGWGTRQHMNATLLVYFSFWLLEFLLFCVWNAVQQQTTHGDLFCSASKDDLLSALLLCQYVFAYMVPAAAVAGHVYFFQFPLASSPSMPDLILLEK